MSSLDSTLDHIPAATLAAAQALQKGRIGDAVIIAEHAKYRISDMVLSALVSDLERVIDEPAPHIKTGSVTGEFRQGGMYLSSSLLLVVRLLNNNGSGPD